MTAASGIRIFLAFVISAAFFAAVAWLSTVPSYRQIEAGDALIKLSFTHGADRTSLCRKRTPEELAKLPPNMRTPLDCPRRRGDIYAELSIDGRQVYAATLPPTGLSGDGPSRVYRRFTVPAGRHKIVVGMRDTPRAQGFDHAAERTVELAAGQSLAIDFRTELGGFVIR